MIIENPTLTLTFVSNDLEAGHQSTQVINDNSIIRGSITFAYQLLNGLKSSSNQVSLQLEKDCASIEDIIATEGDIKAVLADGENLLFTGYLSTNYSWRVTQTGKQALGITLEDVGTRLLGKAFIPSGNHLFNCTASAAIGAICASAGISVSESCLTIDDMVTKTVDSSLSCKDILDKMLYELNRVYFFDAAGKLCLFNIDCTTTEGIPTLDKEDLYVVGGKAISLSKKIRQYKSARVSFTRLGTTSNYLIYRNTSGRDEGHPYCYMKLEAGEHFDGSEIFSPAEWDDAQSDTFREPALIQSCNANSEITLVGSNEIIALSNVTVEFTAQSGSVTCSITEAGGPYIKIEVHNSGSLPYYITRMDAYADIIYTKDTHIIRTGDIAITGDASDNLLSEELEFVHTQELASAHANLLSQYHRYSNAVYSFYAKQDITPGTIIRLVDNAFSGLEVTVLVTAKTYTDGREVIQYTALGISVFDLTAETYSQRIDRGKNDTVGAQGLPGEDAISVEIISHHGTIFRPAVVDTTLEAKVYKAGTDVTDTYLDADFRWIRTSEDTQADAVWNSAHFSMGGKTLSITDSDVYGRAVFFCELLTKR